MDAKAEVSSYPNLHQYMVVERTQTVDLPTGVVLVQLVTVS
ncbi:hypothetical protein C6341_g12439 [Phytophthora cactorum]|nr:hypothetical protein PC120_g10337 [Phytophthora cactorum]KAG3165176.1 hypothetical protein C6341_g12439 [Phytophthora cactorum]